MSKDKTFHCFDWTRATETPTRTSLGHTRVSVTFGWDLCGDEVWSVVCSFDLFNGINRIKCRNWISNGISTICTNYILFSGCWLPAVVCAQLISVSHSLVYNRRHDRWTQHENKQTKQSVLHPRNTNATSILSPIFVNFSFGWRRICVVVTRGISLCDAEEFKWTNLCWNFEQFYLCRIVCCRPKANTNVVMQIEWA